jgi:hypothetical protein
LQVKIKEIDMRTYKEWRRERFLDEVSDWLIKMEKWLEEEEGPAPEIRKVAADDVAAPHAEQRRHGDLMQHE